MSLFYVLVAASVVLVDSVLIGCHCFLSKWLPVLYVPVAASALCPSGYQCFMSLWLPVLYDCISAVYVPLRVSALTYLRVLVLYGHVADCFIPVWLSIIYDPVAVSASCCCGYTDTCTV